MPEVVLTFGNRRQQVSPIALGGKILLQRRRVVADRVPRRCVGVAVTEFEFECKVPSYICVLAVCRRRELERLSVSMPDEKEPGPDLRDPVVCGVQNLPRER